MPCAAHRCTGFAWRCGRSTQASSTRPSTSRPAWSACSRCAPSGRPTGRCVAGCRAVQFLLEDGSRGYRHRLTQPVARLVLRRSASCSTTCVRAYESMQHRPESAYAYCGRATACHTTRLACSTPTSGCCLHTQVFAGDEVKDMPGHLMLYPYRVDQTGTVTAVTELIPDSKKAKTLGQRSATLPCPLTT